MSALVRPVRLERAEKSGNHALEPAEGDGSARIRKRYGEARLRYGIAVSC